ncbi:asparaginyl-tRNA synthetase [Gyrodon lividus]|nr:asparaginyl-tRNA synthetase [Gyrodon lividus]
MFFQRFASTSAWTLPQTIRQILSSRQQPASKIHVHGWVKSVRRQKNVTFAVINDGSCASGLQAVLNNNLSATLHSLTNGTSVRMIGSLVVSRGPGQAKELQVDSIEVLGECNPETYPIQKQTLSVEYLRDHAHLRPRTDANASMLRLRNSLLKSLHDFFERHDFCYAHTPILTSSDCEGAGETFRVVPSLAPSPVPPPQETAPSDTNSEFFTKPAYLTVSSQLHLEVIASSLARVYTLSPCFRAERSQTNRHLAEFWMLEAEWAWTRGVSDVCGLVEACVRDALGAGRDERALLTKGITGHEQRLRSLEVAASSEPWARMTYTEAIAELEKYHTSSEVRARPFTFAPKWGHGLQSEHEKWLSEVLVKGPVFVTDYPSVLKPFYMRMNDDERTVACFDLLVPYVGELVGGSLREERLEALQKRMAVHRLDPEGEEYGWYVDLRRFGSAPHGGFGMGFERLVSWLSGIENVRECIAMPRWAKRMLL